MLTTASKSWRNCSVDGGASSSEVEFAIALPLGGWTGAGTDGLLACGRGAKPVRRGDAGGPSTGIGARALDGGVIRREGGEGAVVPRGVGAAARTGAAGTDDADGPSTGAPCMQYPRIRS